MPPNSHPGCPPARLLPAPCRINVGLRKSRPPTRRDNNRALGVARALRSYYGMAVISANYSHNDVRVIIKGTKQPRRPARAHRRRLAGGGGSHAPRGKVAAPRAGRPANGVAPVWGWDLGRAQPMGRPRFGVGGSLEEPNQWCCPALGWVGLWKSPTNGVGPLGSGWVLGRAQPMVRPQFGVGGSWEEPNQWHFPAVGWEGLGLSPASDISPI